VHTEAEQQLWNECARLIANTINRRDVWRAARPIEPTSSH
jgi:hypothetical protein